MKYYSPDWFDALTIVIVGVWLGGFVDPLLSLVVVAVVQTVGAIINRTELADGGFNFPTVAIFTVAGWLIRAGIETVVLDTVAGVIKSVSCIPHCCKLVVDMVIGCCDVSFSTEIDTRGVFVIAGLKIKWI